MTEVAAGRSRDAGASATACACAPLQARYITRCHVCVRKNGPL